MVIIPYRPNMSSFNFRTASTIDNAEAGHSAGKIVNRSNTSSESHIPKWTEPQLLDNWSHPRLGLFCYYHFSAFYLVIYRLSKAQLQNELILVIGNQPDRTTKCSLVCASVLFHKSIFQILLILAEWYSMLKFKKICHESIVVGVSMWVSFNPLYSRSCKIYLATTSAHSICTLPPWFVINNPITNSGLGLIQVGFGEVITNLRQIIVSWVDFCSENAFC